MEAIFLALLCGIVLGWLALRGLGWLCMLICLFCLPNAHGFFTYAVKNDGGSSVTWILERQVGGVGAWNNIQGATTIAGGRFPTSGFQNQANGATDKYRVKNTGTSETSSEIQDDNTGNAMNILWTWTGTNWNNPVFLYYMNGCVTNTSALPVQFQVRYIAGGVTTYGELSPMTNPGEKWCQSATNTVPFTYQFLYAAYHPDGDTNNPIAVGTMGGPFNAFTNTVPTTGQSGSGQYAGQAPNNPVGGSGGAAVGVGSNTNLTGGQYAAGVSNIINVNYQISESITKGLANIAQTISSNGSGGPDYTDWFRAISNQTAVTTNTLAAVLGQSGTNIAGTNVLSVNTNLLAAEQTFLDGAIASGVALSNAFFVAQQNVSTQLSLAGLDTSGDFSMFETGAKMNFAGTQTIDLDPRSADIWDLLPWVRLVAVWIMTILAIGWVKYEVMKAAIELNMVPGAGPAKSLIGFVGYKMSAVAATVLFAVFPIALGAAITSIVSLNGGGVPMPLSSTAFSTAGVYAPALRGGVQLMLELFPWTYASALVAYLIVFDHSCQGMLLFVQRTMRVVSN